MVLRGYIFSGIQGAVLEKERKIMDKKNLGKPAVIIFASFLILLGIVAYFTEEVFAKEIVVKVGVAMDQTGPLSTEGRKETTAWLWYEEYINNEKEGWKDISGNTVKLKVLYGDTGFNPAKTISLYKKFKGEGIVAISNVGSVELAAIRNMLLEDKIPAPTNSGSLIYPLPSPAFGHWADYSGCSAAVIDYIKQKWEGSKATWTKKRPPRLAFIGPEAYPSWEAGMTPEVMRYAKLNGVEIVGQFFIPLRPIDTKPQIMAAKAKKADFIYTGVVSGQGGPVVRDLYESGLRGDPTKDEGKIEIIGMFPMAALDVIKVAGGKKEAVEGMMIVGSLSFVWEDQPAFRVLRKYAEKYGETKELDQYYVAGWYMALRTDKAIELALKKVTGDKLKGSDVWEGFLNIKDFDTGGIVPGKISYSEEGRIGMEKIRIERVEGEKHILVTHVDRKMLAPIFTEDYAKARGKKSIYSEESLKLLKLTMEEVGYERIKK